MADLKFVADFSDIQTMRRELVGVAKDAKQSAGVFEREYNKAERQLQKTAKANQEFFNSVMGINKANKDASKSASVFVQELQRQEKATAAYSKEITRLRSKYVEGYGASQKFKKEVRDLIQAKRKGIITTDQYGDAVQRLKTDFRDFQGGVVKGSNQFATYNTSVYQANQRTKRFASVGLQQAGYQVGDFAVQLQGGTNAAVAFGQQGSQLLGIFGAWGAVAGAALAIATAFAAPLLDMAKASDKAGQSLEKFKDATKSAKESISDMRFELEALNAGFEDLEKFALDKAMREAQAEVTRIEATVERLRQAVEDSDTITSGRGADRLSTLRTQLALEQASLEAAKEELEEYTKLTEALGENEAAQERISQTVENIKRGVSDVVSNFGGLLPKVSPVQAKLLEMNQTLSDMTGINLAGVYQRANTWATRLLNNTAATAGILKGLSADFQAAYNRSQVIAGVESGRLPPQALEDLPTSPQEDAYQTAMEIRRQYANLNVGSGSGSGGSGGAGSISQTTEQVKDLTNAIEEQETALQKVGKTMSSSLGDALKSVVNGTKSAADAFTDMARKILKKAFDLLVVKPIMNNILGAFGVSTGGGLGMSQSNASALISQTITALQSNGGAWNKGVQMFADGGVVGSPTAFRHSGGLGVMGEAGPEAIMPLKRGKNGKLGVQSEGGQQTVVINQNFNLSANGDESVKRIIQQEAPKIASYTQQQILDQRRRGGAMKQTFGG